MTTQNPKVAAAEKKIADAKANLSKVKEAERVKAEKEAERVKAKKEAEKAKAVAARKKGKK